MTQVLQECRGAKGKESHKAISHEGDPLNVGDFRIDMEGRTVRLREQKIALSAEEFDLLVFLVMNRKKMVTPQTTLSTQWGGTHVHQAQFLQVLLSLKKKLDLVATD